MFTLISWQNPGTCDVVRLRRLAALTEKSYNVEQDDKAVQTTGTLCSNTHTPVPPSTGHWQLASTQHQINLHTVETIARSSDIYLLTPMSCSSLTTGTISISLIFTLLGKQRLAQPREWSVRHTQYRNFKHLKKGFPKKDWEFTVSQKIRKKARLRGCLSQPKGM